MSASSVRATAARIQRRARRPNPPAGERLPLSSLRMRLDARSDDTTWLVNPDGVLGRVLQVPANGAATFPLSLDRSVWFQARPMLFPHDWRDRSGTVRASVAVVQPGGMTNTLSVVTLKASDFGRPRGARVRCEIPASSIALILGIQLLEATGPYPLERAVWVDPVIVDPHAPPPPAPGAQRDQPSPAPPRGDGPLISVLTPVHNPPPQMLEEAIASVRAQTFTDWELCLVDDGSSDPEIIAALNRHAAADPRIRVCRRERAGGISAATNAALELATGQYIALLDHDDTLTPDALAHVADQITNNPSLDMIYSDEDIVVDGRRIWAHLKPQWSPDTMRTNGYTCHLGVYRRALVSQLGGFRTEFNGSQDVDMILRLVEHTDRIAHIPRVLYHWRAHSGSTAGGDAKPYAYVAARNAITEHLERTGIDADVGFGPPGLYRVAHHVNASARVDLVLAVDSENGLTQAARSWLKQPHPTWNIVLAAPADKLAAAASALTTAGIPQTRITTIPTAPGQSLANALKAAADAATAEHLLLMQTLATGLTHDWLTRLLGYSQQTDVAAAGPIVLAADGRIQQAGIALPQGIPLHLLHGTRSSMDHLFGYGTSVFNVSAVSGVLATPRDTYHQLGGLQPQFNDLTLIEYCLRATDADQRIVIVPDARLRATGPDHTTNDLTAIWRLRQTWAQTHTHDPYYNPNYRTDRGDFKPAWT